jgi:hypothetical protein
MPAKLNKEVLIDIDLSVDAEIERTILDRVGVKPKVTSTMLDATHLLFVHVAPGSCRAMSTSSASWRSAIRSQHIVAVMGKTIDQVYWQFPPEESLKPVGGGPAMTLFRKPHRHLDPADTLAELIFTSSWS